MIHYTRGVLRLACKVAGATLIACAMASAKAEQTAVGGQSPETTSQYGWVPTPTTPLRAGCDAFTGDMAELGVLEAFSEASKYVWKLRDTRDNWSPRSASLQLHARDLENTYRTEERARRSRIFSRTLSAEGQAARAELEYLRRTDPPIQGIVEDLLKQHDTAHTAFESAYIDALTGEAARQRSFATIYRLAERSEQIDECVSIHGVSWNWPFIPLQEVTRRARDQHSRQPVDAALGVAIRMADARGAEELIAEFESLDDHRSFQHRWNMPPQTVRTALRDHPVGQYAQQRYRMHREEQERARSVRELEARLAEERREIQQSLQAVQRRIFNIGIDGWGRLEGEPYRVGVIERVNDTQVQTIMECREPEAHQIAVSVTVDPDADWVFDPERGLYVDWGNRVERLGISYRQQGNSRYTNTIVFNFLDEEMWRRAMASGRAASPVGALVDQLFGGMVADALEASNRLIVPLPGARASQTLDLYAEARIDGQIRRLRFVQLGTDQTVSLDDIASACGYFEE